MDVSEERAIPIFRFVAEGGGSTFFRNVTSQRITLTVSGSSGPLAGIFINDSVCIFICKVHEQKSCLPIRPRRDYFPKIMDLFC
jgi:hypothetical protein